MPRDTLTIIDNRTGQEYEIPIEHNTIPGTEINKIKATPDGPGLREVTYGSQKLVVENTCFYAGNRARIDDARDQKRGLCKYAGSWREYLEKLGVVGRDTAKHPWGD